MEFGPTARTGHVAVSDGDYILVWGGYKEYQTNEPNVYLNGSELWAYNVLTERWSLKRCTKGDIPSGTSGAVALLASNYIYIFGGYQEDGNTKELYRLDLLNFEWKHLSPKGLVPLSMDKFAGWEYEGKLYYFGGFGVIPSNFSRDYPDFQFVLGDAGYADARRGWMNQFICYDPSTNEWTVPPIKGPLPSARAAHSAAMLNDKVYIFGGRHQQMRMNDLHCLDMKTMEWSVPLTITDSCPEGRSWHSLTALGSNWLVLYGGFNQNNIPLADCWIMDINVMKWKEVTLGFNFPRLWHTASVSVYNEIIIYGGCTENILDARIEAVMARATGIVVLRFSPKSLYRRCLDVVEKLRGLTKEFHSLPLHIQNVLRIRMNLTCSGSLHGS